MRAICGWLLLVPDKNKITSTPVHFANVADRQWKSCFTNVVNWKLPYHIYRLCALIINASFWILTSDMYLYPQYRKSTYYHVLYISILDILSHQRLFMSCSPCNTTLAAWKLDYIICSARWTRNNNCSWPWVIIVYNKIKVFNSLPAGHKKKLILFLQLKIIAYKHSESKLIGWLWKMKSLMCSNSPKI